MNGFVVRVVGKAEDNTFAAKRMKANNLPMFMMGSLVFFLRLIDFNLQMMLRLDGRNVGAVLYI